MSNSIKGHKNSFLIFFLIAFVGGYFFFFSSSVWYPQNKDLVKATQLNKIETWNDRDISLLCWNYSPDQHMMEIQIEIVNRSLDGINNYQYGAIERKSGQVDVSSVLEKNDFVVLRITDIRPNWKEFSLRISLPDNAESDSTSKSELKLYTNIKEISLVDHIEDKTESEYQIARYEQHISNYENIVEELRKQKEELELDIVSHRDEIQEWEEQKKFQTAEQIEETDQIIGNANTSISKKESEILAIDQQIEENQERIKKAEEQISSFRDP